MLNPAREVEVQVDAEGVPRRLRGDPLLGSLRPVLSWRAEVDWWERPVLREYWRALLQDRLLLEIYHELDSGRWFLERVFD
ncbi:MAG TPA: hypothetical protein VNI34_02660 [Candidatus Nitrosotalea sp.]|nr:hypothetical protein [Candidatus Nitrosotalea sp.]